MAALVGFLAVVSTGSSLGVELSAGTDVVLKAATVRLSNENGTPLTVPAPESYRRFSLDEVRGERVRIHSGSLSGWVRADEIVPLADAVRYYTQRIREKPDSAWDYNARAMVWVDRHEPEIAIGDLTEAIRLAPRSARLFVNRGLARLAVGDETRALVDFQTAIRLAPEDSEAYHGRALVRLARGDCGQAVEDLTRALSLDPGNAALYRDRGLAEARLEAYLKAESDYRAALQRNAQDVWALTALAWLRATCPDARLRNGAEAVRLARQANEKSGWADPYQVGTLAAAFAEAGDFPEAVRWQIRALELFRRDDPGLDGHRRRLALYREGRAYHEGASP